MPNDLNQMPENLESDGADGNGAWALSPQFVAELRGLYQEFRIRPAEEYLPTLSDYFERNRVATTNRQKRFRADLRKVYTDIAPPASEHHLQKLATQFQGWRQKTTSLIQQALDDLPDDDPLRCPISLFGAMQLGRLETAHTSLLTWLLDPAKEHGFGTSLLHAFLVHFSGDSPPETIQVEKIKAEFPLEDGRIDVLVQGKYASADGHSKGWLLVIEAKVDANEGEQQLKKYDRWILRNRHGRQVYRVFLTAEGRKPETSDEEWVSLSFLQLACILRKAYQELRACAGFHLLRHYLAGVLQDICHWQLPVTTAATVADPYGFVEYLQIVQASIRKGTDDDTAR